MCDANVVASRAASLRIRSQCTASVVVLDVIVYHVCCVCLVYIRYTINMDLMMFALVYTNLEQSTARQYDTTSRYARLCECAARFMVCYNY